MTLSVSEHTSKKTQELLRECTTHYHTVSIGIVDGRIEACRIFPRIWEGTGHVFAEPWNEASGRDGSWPILWKIVNATGVGWGAGHGHSHQVRSKSGLTRGVYTFDRKWWIQAIEIGKKTWVKVDGVFRMKHHPSLFRLLGNCEYCGGSDEYCAVTYEDYVVRDVLE